MSDCPQLWGSLSDFLSFFSSQLWKVPLMRSRLRWLEEKTPLASTWSLWRSVCPGWGGAAVPLSSRASFQPKAAKSTPRSSTSLVSRHCRRRNEFPRWSSSFHLVPPVWTPNSPFPFVICLKIQCFFLANNFHLLVQQWLKGAFNRSVLKPKRNTTFSNLRELA